MYLSISNIYIHVCIANATLYDFIIDGPLALKITLKMIMVFKHPFKTKQRSKYATEKMRYDSFFLFAFGRMLFSPNFLLHRGNEAVLICCLLFSIFGLFSDVYFTKMIRIDDTCYRYIIKPFSYEVTFAY